MALIHDQIAAPNKVTTEYDEYGEPTGITSTHFERAVDAYTYALMAATYPSDTRIRMGAIQAAEHLGFDYITAVGAAWEKLSLSFQEARFAVAESFGDIVRQMLENGAKSREDQLTNGKSADVRGFEDTDDYGSLA